MKTSRPPLCPSAQPDLDDARAFAVVGGAPGAPRLTWIEQAVPVTPELLAMTGDAPPTQVLRFTARCQEKSCSHFDGRDCRLATRLVAMIEPVVDRLPHCAIRADCRWHRQEGGATCLRCPQIVTQTVNPSDLLVRAATPVVAADGEGRSEDQT